MVTVKTLRDWFRIYSEPFKLKTSIHFLKLIILSSVVFCVLDKTGLWIMHPVFSFMMTSKLVVVDDIKLRRVVSLLSAFVSLSGMPWLTPLIVVCYAMVDQGIMEDSYADQFKTISDWVWMQWEALVPSAHPIAGLNDGGLLAGAYERITGQCEGFMEYMADAKFMQFDVVATFLRTVEVNTHINELGGRPHLHGSNFMEKVKSAQKRQRLFILGGVSFLILMVFRQPYVLLISLGLMFTKFLEKQTSLPKSRKSRYTVEDGVYFIQSLLIGLPISHGIGVAHSGVLHVPYHVCNAQAIVLGKTTMMPYYVSVDEDLVTYGGPPAFSRPVDGNVVYVNTETMHASITHQVVVERDDGSAIFAWMGVTNPGESGSPVFGYTETGEFELYGLAGRYYKDADGVTEFASVFGIDSDREASRPEVEQVLMGPGQGKTTRVLPNEIAKFLNANRNKKVLVAGPTRAVCREIASALSSKFSTSINIKGERLRNHRAPVQVASHHTALAMLMSGDRALANLGFIILDEAHMRDSSTISLRRYLRYFTELGGKAMEMSATLDDRVIKDSNYPIEEQTFKRNKLEETIKEFLERGLKVMVFVKSLKNSETIRMMRSFPGSVGLSRQSYRNNIEFIHNEEVRLIFTTNISECGLNVRDLDVVIDLANEFTYVCENNVIFGKEKNISTASMVQRRGRVGRFRPGIYVIDESWVPDDTKDGVAHLEADILCTGRDWAPGQGNSLNVYMSDAQVVKGLEEMLDPIETYLRFDRFGKKRERKDQKMILARLHTEGSDYTGCGKDNCPCIGKWKWFDERLHDLMVGKVTISGVDLFS